MVLHEHDTKKSIHTDVLLLLASVYKVKTYLELGVGLGDNFEKMAAIVPDSIAVDMSKSYIPKKGIFINKSTDAFFSDNNTVFDMIFIDACHDFEQVKIDLTNALKVLTINGVIVLHDTDPEAPWLFTREKCSDSYKIIDYIYEMYGNEYDCITLPVDVCGVTILVNKNNKRFLNFIER